MKKIEEERISKETMTEFYIDKNLSYENVAKELGLTLSQVRRLCKKYGLKKDISTWKESAKRTNVEKYGAENPFANEEVKKKIVNTNLAKYGVKYAINNADVKQKALDTFYSHYGRYNYDYLDIDEDKIQELNDADTLRSKIKELQLKTPEALKEYIGFKGMCSVYRLINKLGLQDLMDPYTSCYETEITNLLRGWGISCYKSKKIIAPYEIDIYCPDYKIGIEINGNLYHSFNADNAPHCEGKDKFYHRMKSELAEKQGVFLFHIFEYELLDKRKKEIIFSQLRNLFFKNNTRIFARNCEICEISREEKNQFLLENHRQGADNSAVYYGLKHDGKIVSVMTFAKPRFTTKYEWELVRFCSLRDTTVIGGASKLFKFFTDTHRGCIISYSDMAKTSGKVYSKMGFTFTAYSEPNYVWCNNLNVIKTRYQTQMKDEVKIMTESGFWRIYDCGSKIWIYNH